MPRVISAERRAAGMSFAIRRAPHLLRALGNLLQRRQDVVLRIQWLFVVLYAFLLIAPVLLPAPPAQATVFNSLARFSEALFWGVWWPGVILVTLLFGQFWCGILCPDGTLTEFISRRGLGRKIPSWLRWAGWPLLGFALLTVYEHLTDAYHSSQATLLLVGGASLLAVLTGALIGRGKRVWCRYLCPLSSIFSLLSRCAILHFRVDRNAWDSANRPSRAPGTQTRAVDCPLLLDVRRLRSNEKCSMCGRCSGHRNAVELAIRQPGGEIAALGVGEGVARTWEALAIVFVLIGLCYSALHWRGGPWHAVLLASVVGTWPSWLAALLAILAPALIIGSSIALLLLLAGAGSLQRSLRLAYGLIPLAGIGLFLGSLEYSLVILERQGVHVAHLLPFLRATCLLPAFAWSVRLGWLQLRGELIPSLHRYGVMGIYLLAAALLAACYQLAFFAL